MEASQYKDYVLVLLFVKYVSDGQPKTVPFFIDSKTQLKTFDYVVANPPFSDKRWSTGLTPESDIYGRFEGFGIPPAKQGDYAYLLHIVRSPNYKKPS